MSDLLPPNAAPAERAYDRNAAERISGLNAPVRDMWDPERCPEQSLPWLAWAFSVDNWNDLWTEGQKRATIAASVDVHRRKGTVASIKRALVAAGYGDAQLIEHWGLVSYDGSVDHDGTETHEPSGHWAEYRVRLERPIRNDQAIQVREILANVAPVRCHLDRLDFSEVAHLYDGEILYDGSFNYGAA